MNQNSNPTPTQVTVTVPKPQHGNDMTTRINSDKGSTVATPNPRKTSPKGRI